eukprot:3168751-Amphidinium_carterae.1
MGVLCSFAAYVNVPGRPPRHTVVLLHGLNTPQSDSVDQPSTSCKTYKDAIYPLQSPCKPWKDELLQTE